jgi:ubiquinone/menaquinone biosynthesis C-methylase UbiE
MTGRSPETVEGDYRRGAIMIIQKSEDPKGFTSFEHEGWQTVSAGYELHFERLTGQTAPATLDAAGVGPDMRVLDVCTGPGILATAVQERGATVVGLDFSDEPRSSEVMPRPCRSTTTVSMQWSVAMA